MHCTTLYKTNSQLTVNLPRNVDDQKDYIP